MPKKSYLEYDEQKLSNFVNIYWWKYADEQVYSLFARPMTKNEQDDLNLIRSKVILLGRYYLTNIEKKEESLKIARSIMASGYGFGVPSLRQKDFLQTTNIYTVHANLTKEISSATETWETVFSSKWLHFHHPNTFPILDRKVEGKLFEHRVICRNWSEIIDEYQLFFSDLKTDGEDYDDRYCLFCFCLLKLRKYFYENTRHKDLTLKMLDVYLYT